MSETDLDVGGTAPQGSPNGNGEGNTPPNTLTPPVPPVETPQGINEEEALPRLALEDHYDEGVKDIVTTLNHFLPNLDLQRAFGQALDSGDSQAIDRNYIREIVGEDSIVESLIRTIGSVADSYGNTSDTAYQEVFDSVGGQEQWQGIATFFNQNATEAEKNYARRLTTSKNPSEIKEGAEFVKAYAQRLGAINKTPAKLGTGTGNLGGRGLSREEYQQKYQELRQSPTWNTDVASRNAQVAELDRLRQVGIQMGL